jgi:predicted XRE-type DNA-binding protein
MSKKVNFVYEWIGPTGPISNNRVPTLVDVVQSAGGELRNNVGHLSQIPHFFRRVPQKQILSSSNLPDSTFLYEINFGPMHYHRPELRIFDPQDGILSQAVIHPNVINRVKNKQAYICFTLLHEGYMQDKFLTALLNYFKSLQVPLSQVIYVTNCGNPKEVYADYCTRIGQPAEINVEYCPTFRVDKDGVEIAMNNITYTPGPKKKTFLCFNRRFSDHRLMFYMLCKKNNLLDYFYMSMNSYHPDSRTPFIEFAKHLVYRMPKFGLVEQDAQDASNILPLILDTTDFSQYPMEKSHTTVADLYSSSLINIVNETYFFNNIIHITEKTYKPIAYMQPFIMVGAPGSLKHIKDMGFKTFDQYWDESYDLEKDHVNRLAMIMNLVESISNWPEDRKLQFSHAVVSILEYNQNHLRTMPNIEMDQFVEKYGV